MRAALLGRCGRLRQEAEFERVRAEGRSWSTPLLVLRAARNDAGSTRVGIIASKRVGKAVRRNRARRRVREVIRRLCPDLDVGWDLIVTVRTPLLDAAFGRIESDLRDLARRAGVCAGPSEGDHASSDGLPC